jgi:hypothetical protein
MEEWEGTRNKQHLIEVGQGKNGVEWSQNETGKSRYDS